MDVVKYKIVQLFAEQAAHAANLAIFGVTHDGGDAVAWHRAESAAIDVEINRHLNVLSSLVLEQRLLAAAQAPPPAPVLPPAPAPALAAPIQEVVAPARRRALVAPEEKAKADREIKRLDNRLLDYWQVVLGLKQKAFNKLGPDGKPIELQGGQRVKVGPEMEAEAKQRQVPLYPPSYWHRAAHNADPEAMLAKLHSDWGKMHEGANRWDREYWRTTVVPQLTRETEQKDRPVARGQRLSAGPIRNARAPEVRKRDYTIAMYWYALFGLGNKTTHSLRDANGVHLGFEAERKAAVQGVPLYPPDGWSFKDHKARPEYWAQELPRLRQAMRPEENKFNVVGVPRPPHVGEADVYETDDDTVVDGERVGEEDDDPRVGVRRRLGDTYEGEIDDGPARKAHRTGVCSDCFFRGTGYCICGRE